MWIDLLCYIGLGILALFGLGLLGAMAFTVVMVMNDRKYKNEQRK